jgi:flagellar hook-associated protein FlgK
LVTLSTEKLKNQKAELTRQLSDAEVQGNQVEIDQLLAQIGKLNKEIVSGKK